MTNSALRKWAWVHKWSSLVSTIFLLMLCITGLPLIFHHEIDDLLHETAHPAEVVPDTRPANLDGILEKVHERYPGKVIQFVSWDDDEPGVLYLSINDSVAADPLTNQFARFDANTGAFLDEPDFSGRFTMIMYRLHTDMYAGLPGKLFLGLMGLFFVAAIVSGVLIYGPFMRKLNFGEIRQNRARPVRWLDWHNFLGIVVVAWTLVVGATGILNTWADLVIKVWQYTQLTEMLGAGKDKPVPKKLASLEDAVKLAREKLPDMEPQTVAFPGTVFAGPAHYVIFFRGNTPLTSRLLKPVVIDGETGAFTDMRDMPWFVTTLLVSKPLHFGDYGGMTLKIIWAILDLVTIVILVTGLYLWIARRRAPADQALELALPSIERSPA
ncbi:MAG TPA: PepSY-associated TM helix domain-containing protein [Hyphomicrobium sp.]|nr:PepSY-associated TM helix domain-containing protein [Hyphomicrobium sp.]